MAETIQPAPPASPPPPATALDKRRGIVLDPTVVAVGSIVALLGVGLVTALLWMVPSAAAREQYSACRGLRGFDAPTLALCPGGKPCSLPQPAPDFTAIDYQGKPVKLSDFRGKVVLVNFWASWCGVCKSEKPALASMAADLQSDDFTVIALASDRSWSDVLLASVAALKPYAKLPGAERGQSVPLPAALEAYRRELPAGVPFKVFLDPPAGDDTIGQIAARWGITAVPESALIDRKGNIRAYFVNKRDWTSPVARTCLRAVIDE